MNARELKRFKKLLLKEREKVLDEIKGISKESLKRSQRESSGELSGYVYHMADVGTDNYTREFSLDLASAEQKVLYQIDETLKRIEDKTYGNCLSCDKKITKARLISIPYSSFCIDCKKKEERK